jgi:hypothetical protein
MASARWGDIPQNDGTSVTTSYPTAIFPGQQIVSMAAGLGRICAVTAAGAILCQGTGSYGVGSPPS